MTNKENTRILITDDHRMFAEGLKAMLMMQDHLGDPQIAESGEDALKLLAESDFDLLITDINMGGMSGIELTKTVKELYPELKVLVITMYDDYEMINEIFTAEAEGFILKNSPPTDFFQAIEQLLTNHTYYSKDILTVLLNKTRTQKKIQANLSNLTDREIQIIELIAKEYSSDAIAEKLYISKHTVNTHRKNILQKTGIKTLAGLIRFAYENELVR